MIALIASLVLLFYILIPSGIFRFVTSLSLPIKKFHKTKAQDITFAILSCFLPFWVALILVWYAAPWPFPTRESLQQRRQSYRTFFVTMDSDKELEKALTPTADPAKPPVFWPSVNSVLKRQGRFLFWFYLAVGIEAGVFSWIAWQYRVGRKRWRDRIGAWILPPVLSEWHVMLTDFGSPPPRRAIELDILSADGILYMGKLKDYFFDVEGELAGVLLTDPYRFNREEYMDHKRADLEVTLGKQQSLGQTITFTKAPSEYWKRIPGADTFYIPKDRISNINVRRVTPAAAVPAAASVRLADRKIMDLVISEKPKNSEI